MIVPNRLAPVVTTSLTYGVGSDDDTIPGIAHATEHMMFRGTGDISSDQFAGIATRIGAQYNAETTNLFTRYHFTVPAAYLGVVLRLDADRMTGASMLPASWAGERGAIEQEVKAHESSPLYRVGLKMNQVFYGKTPYARETVGTIAGFDRMTAADIAAFYHTWYHPNNATLVIAGDVDPAAALALVSAAFGSIPGAPLPVRAPVVMQALPTSTIERSIDFPVPFVALAFRFPGLRASDYAASQVLMAALDSPRGALTDLALKGKVLGALGLASAYPEVGDGMFFAIARPGSDPKLALADVRGVLAGYAATGVPASLVEAAKTRMLAAKAYSAASIPGQAFAWSVALAQGERTPFAIYDSISKVTPSDVDRVLRAYVAPAHEVALILHATAGASVPKVDTAGLAENVAIAQTHAVALPAWTEPYFAAPLRAPRADDSAQSYHLANGLTLAVRPESFSPTVVLQGHIRTAPDLYEPHGKSGVATLTQTLLAFGSAGYDFKAYQAQLDAIAANVGLGTSFSLTVRAQDFDRAVALLADGELQPAFPASDFALMQRNYAQSLLAMQNRPETQAQLARIDALYPKGDPRRRHATGASVGALTLADVRKWYAFAYRPDLTTIAIVGDVSPAHAKAAIERSFGAWRAKGPKPAFVYPVLHAGKKATSVTVASPTNKQSDVTLSQVIGLHRGDRDAIAIQLANTLLSGEGTGSLLFRDVRTRAGLVYSIDSDAQIGRTGSTFSVSFASDAKNVARAQAAADAAIEGLRTDLLPVQDVQRAKALLLAQGILQLDTYNGVADELLQTSIDGISANDMYRYYTRLLAITPEQIRSAMRKWVDPKRFSRVVVEPQGSP